jgi:predicted phosphoribosyltransferase
MIRFDDRRHAGRMLAAKLGKYAHRRDVLVLALPRGGVPVAYEVARTLGAPLDVLMVRKLGVPGREELALGAIANGGVQVINDDAVAALGISRRTIENVVAAERRELDRRAAAYRGDRPAPDARGKTVIVVDDGLATGATMQAAVSALRAQGAGWIVVAVPTAAPDSRDALRGVANDVVCVTAPEPFHAVGLWYRDFSQTTDVEVRELLESARHDRRDAEYRALRDAEAIAPRYTDWRAEP